MDGETLKEFFFQVSPPFYLLFLFFSAFIENIFPPYPGDTAVVLGTYISHIRDIPLSWIILAIYLGNLTSASIMYFAGRKVLRFYARHSCFSYRVRLFDPYSILKVHHFFQKYGFYTVLFSRFSAGIRFFVSITAGMVRMPFFLFLIAFFIATTLWNSILVGLGYFLSLEWRNLLQILKYYSWMITILLIGIFLFLYFRHRKKKK